MRCGVGTIGATTDFCWFVANHERFVHGAIRLSTVELD